jgi:hypothetical protein
MRFENILLDKLNMKRMRHIVILGFAIIATVALCSAGYYISTQEKIEQVIPYNNLPSKELPIVQNDAFKEGEILSYRLHYGALDAGVILMEVKPEVLEVAGRKVYHIVGNGYSKGTFVWFFKVRRSRRPRPPRRCPVCPRV